MNQPIRSTVSPLDLRCAISRTCSLVLQARTAEEDGGITPSDTFFVTKIEHQGRYVDLTGEPRRAVTIPDTSYVIIERMTDAFVLQGNSGDEFAARVLIDAFVGDVAATREFLGRLAQLNLVAKQRLAAARAKQETAA